MRVLFLSLSLCISLIGCTVDESIHDHSHTQINDKQINITETVRRIASLLDYIASDYPLSVKNGLIVNLFEYREQFDFMRISSNLGERLPKIEGLNFSNELAVLRSEIGKKTDGVVVSKLAHKLRKALLTTYNIVLAPTSAIQDYQTSKNLFAQNCVACHGAEGAGDGFLSASFNPSPINFQDGKVMAEMTPSRVFNVLTDGVVGTAMPSYAALSASERWGLAFYVISLRHKAGNLKRGATAYKKHSIPISTTLTKLSSTHDRDIQIILTNKNIMPQTQQDVLAFLRRVAPYSSRESPFQPTRKALNGAIDAYRTNQYTLANEYLIQAYLDGIEPYESTLRSHNLESEIFTIESLFSQLRSDITQNADMDTFSQKILRIRVLLDSVEETMLGTDNKYIPFISTLSIVLREGLEASLIIFLLLTWTARGQSRQKTNRFIHLGWITALGAGILTWWISGNIIALVSTQHREILEGIMSLVAALILLISSHFVLSRIDARRRVNRLKRHLENALSHRKKQITLVFIVFFAVYREALELVLFLRSILLDRNADPNMVLWGVTVGMLAVIVGTVGLFHFARRLPFGTIILCMSTMLCILAFSLSGQGARALQEAGILSIHPLASNIQIPMLGVYPTLQTIMVQLFALAIFIGIALIPKLKKQEIN